MIDYLTLLFLIITYIISIILVSFSEQYIKISTVIFALFYFLWGLWHHKNEKSLHPKIILEYFIIALLGLYLIISMR